VASAAATAIGALWQWFTVSAQDGSCDASCGIGEAWRVGGMFYDWALCPYPCSGSVDMALWPANVRLPATAIMESTPSLINGFLAATSPLPNRYRVAIVLATIYAQGLYKLPTLTDALDIDIAMTRVVSTILGAGVVSDTRPSPSLPATPIALSLPAAPIARSSRVARVVDKHTIPASHLLTVYRAPLSSV
jgi:hypothetical protein